jgi:hypothetical protein
VASGYERKSETDGAPLQGRHWPRSCAPRPPAAAPDRRFVGCARLLVPLHLVAARRASQMRGLDRDQPRGRAPPNCLLTLTITV